MKRDLAMLQQAGYRLGKMALVELFQGTCHVECIALMTKERG